MWRFIRKGMLFIAIIACALSIVNSSSGITQFSSNREVKMNVVDSENAFIALPEVIKVDVTILRKTIEYYKLYTVDELEKKEDNESKAEFMKLQDQAKDMEPTEVLDLKEGPEFIEDLEPIETPVFFGINSPQVIKEIVKVEEITEITDVNNNLIIKNNMIDDIQLIGMDFDNPKLEVSSGSYSSASFTLSEFWLGSREEVKVPINYNERTLDNLRYGISNVNDYSSKATLYFEWDGGSSTIYKDVVINYIVETETIEQNIDENNQ